jgi:hypothetical protein
VILIAWLPDCDDPEVDAALRRDESLMIMTFFRGGHLIGIGLMSSSAKARLSR